jgi:uncharacterized SAM-binding protein YcdF (DUF218 family)
VFTGAYERIEAGLDLLERGTIRQLLISGVNANAGLSVATFATQFGAGRSQIAKWLACCIELGLRADTTLQNALETACWVAKNEFKGPLVLVTSTAHAARARAALRHLVPEHRILVAAVANAATPSQATRLRGDVREYAKHLTTQFLLWAPGARRLAPDAFGPWSRGCPE